MDTLEELMQSQVRRHRVYMPTLEERMKAQALVDRGEIKNTPRSGVLGSMADFLDPLSKFLDRYKLPESIPLLGGASAADLTGVKGSQGLLDDMSYGQSPIKGGPTLQTFKTDPRALDLAALPGTITGTTIAAKGLGKAALKEGAKQIETGTGLLGRNVIDPRMRILAGKDVPVDQQIVRHGDAQAMSVPDKPFKFGGKDFYKTESGNAYAGDSLISEGEYQSAMKQALSGNDGGLNYQIQHKPMNVKGGAAPLHDLISAYGDDVYGKNALQYFGSGDAREYGTLRLLQSLRGKPNAPVTIYRGAPSESGGINAGDWVTLDKSVAQDYVDQALANEGKAGRVFSQKVPASHITSWPDSLLEFGYHPPAKSVPEPFKVYHGSGANFDVFDPSKAKTAEHIYTSPDAGDAGQYGKPMEFMAKPGNPIDLTSDNMTREGMAKLKAAANDLGLTHENMTFDDWYQQVFEPGQMYQYYGRQNEQNQLMRELFGSGNDAVRIPDAGFGGGMSNSWVFENPKLLQRVPAKTKKGK